jgi:hypothetical protein
MSKSRDNVINIKRGPELIREAREARERAERERQANACMILGWPWPGGIDDLPIGGLDA